MLRRMTWRAESNEVPECAVIQVQSPRCEYEPYLRFTDCSHQHPQTNGKLERSHETLKARLNLLVFTSPEALLAAMAEFIKFYI